MPPLRSVTAASALICLCAIFFILWTYTTSSADGNAPLPLDPLPPGTSPAYGDRPVAAPWTSWFQPGVWAGSRFPSRNGGRVADDWNILYHLGGNGPWVQKVDGVITNELAPPEGCEVQQVHMVSGLSVEWVRADGG
jgi:acid phosphatase